jgi:mRNA-degrading endonuclease RelE of RelBE toxin-antitoxin system
MQKIDKFIARLQKEQHEKIVAVLKRIERRDLEGLAVRKLQGASDRYRVRVGRVRIKFAMDDAGIVVYDIENRADTTYRKP